MKYLVGLFLTVSTVFSASAQTSPKIDLVINGVAGNTSYSTVIKKLGKPLREMPEDGEIDQCTQGLGSMLYYDGFTINTMGDKDGNNQTVLDMEITSPKWVTDKGIRISATPKQVMTKYGKDKYEDAFEWTDEGKRVFTGEKWLSYEMKTNGPGAVYFYFKNDRLVRIELKATTC